MLKLLPRSLLVLLLFFSLVASGGDKLTDSSGTEYAVEWNNPSNAAASRSLFIDTFLHLYREAREGFPADKRKWLTEAFNEDMDEMVANPVRYRWVVAKNGEGRTVGFASFDVTDPERIYVMQMAVDPELQRSGIGRQLLFSILEEFRSVKHLNLITRRMNEQATAFYQRLGFNESEFMRKGYDAKKYIGMYLDIPEGECSVLFHKFVRPVTQ